ncbi:DNA-3-methyladenine glycosylase family protein [Brachybacterium paraconglomeratum]|uniref:DNA-3-methyladenine glycosylase family protein n=1 Tax=Brachybacterium paraconglomeratum TaxID=173362 RepID=UPI0022AF80D0|nr:AlkA N-terminal domain-containing protein [Brachybacterium paraconglomeratum]MCZ4326133.1 3-methyladenine DNA glycosylase [Brachybacterium paraconglomeratum]
MTGPDTAAWSRRRVDVAGPFDHRAALATLAAHAVDGLHHLDLETGTFTRWVQVEDAQHLVTTRLETGGASLATPSGDPAVLDALADLTAHWFDLAADLGPVDARLGADPLFAAQVRERPGLRITRFRRPFEAVVCTVLGQQVSLAAGRLFAARLVAAHGTAPRGEAAPLRAFPAPAALAEIPLEELRATIGLTGSRARTVHEAAVLCAEHGGGAVLPPREALAAVHGIGAWTLDHLALRAGTDADAYPAGDAVLRRTLAALDPSADAARIASWSPYRGYAATRLWAFGR